MGVGTNGGWALRKASLTLQGKTSNVAISYKSFNSFSPPPIIPTPINWGNYNNYAPLAIAFGGLNLLGKGNIIIKGCYCLQGTTKENRYVGVRILPFVNFILPCPYLIGQL